MLGVRGYDWGRIGVGSLTGDPRVARIPRERGSVAHSDLKAQAFQTMGSYGCGFTGSAFNIRCSIKRGFAPEWSNPDRRAINALERH